MSEDVITSTVEEDEELSFPSLYSFAGGVVQLSTIIIVVALFFVTSIVHMDSFSEMDPTDKIAPEMRAFLYVFNLICYINIATAVVGIFKSRGERRKMVVVAVIASAVCLGINSLLPFLF